MHNRAYRWLGMWLCVSCLAAAQADNNQFVADQQAWVGWLELSGLIPDTPPRCLGNVRTHLNSCMQLRSDPVLTMIPAVLTVK